MTLTVQRPLVLVGCGKMGGAMLSGWLESGIAAAGVIAVEPMGAADFDGRPEVEIVAGPEALPETLDPEVVVFAVKPQQMDEVAGATISYFTQQLGPGAAIVRAMPNTPAAIGQGITVCCGNAVASAAQGELCRALLSAVGEAIVVDDEALIDGVTALSGSGPAYIFLLIECMTEAGVAVGLPRDRAARLALVTVAGSGQLALTGDVPPATLRENVTSPGGTTFEALQVLMAEDGLQPLMTRAIEAAARRSRELAG